MIPGQFFLVLIKCIRLISLSPRSIHIQSDAKSFKIHIQQSDSEHLFQAITLFSYCSPIKAVF